MEMPAVPDRRVQVRSGQANRGANQASDGESNKSSDDGVSNESSDEDSSANNSNNMEDDNDIFDEYGPPLDDDDMKEFSELAVDKKDQLDAAKFPDEPFLRRIYNGVVRKLSQVESYMTVNLICTGIWSVVYKILRFSINMERFDYIRVNYPQANTVVKMVFHSCVKPSRCSIY